MQKSSLKETKVRISCGCIRAMQSKWSDEYDLGVSILYLGKVTLHVVSDHSANVVRWIHVICVTDRVDTGSQVF